MALSCSASGTDDGDGEPQPRVVSLAHLLQGADAALPEYLTLSLTAAEIEQRWPEPPEEVTLRHINAPPGYLSLTTLDEEEQGPSDPAAADAKTSSGGSPVANDASIMSTGAAEAALVHAASVNNALPPKKRKLADRDCQETAGTAPASRSPSLSLAMVIHGDDASRPSTSRLSSSTHSRDVETRSTVEMAAEPIDAVPLRAAYLVGPPEPAWVRETLGLPVNHPLYFIATKVIEQSDMNTQQSRFLIPQAIARLRPLLSDKQRLDANMIKEEPAPKKKKKKPTLQPSGCDGKKPRVLGKKHGGLLVHVVVNSDGHQMDAELTTWDSSRTSVLKFGKNHQMFVGMSGLKLKDEVHIWALLHRDGDLYLVITAAVTPQQAGQPVAEFGTGIV